MFRFLLAAGDVILDSGCSRSIVPAHKDSKVDAKSRSDPHSANSKRSTVSSKGFLRAFKVFFAL